MSITRTGTTKQYADNWENIFGGGTKRSASKVTAKTKSPKKKVAKKSKPAGKSGKSSQRKK